MSQYLRDLTARLRWKVDDRELNSNRDALGRFVKQADTLDKKAIRLGKSLAGAFAVRAVVRGATDAAEAAIEFDRTLGDLQSLLPGQTQRVKDLGAAIRGLSVESGKSAEDLSRATYQIISSFGDTEDTVENLRLVTQAATAGNTDASSAIDLLSAVTLAYGDSSLKAQRRVSDLAFTTVRLGKTTLPELAAAVGQVTPAFASLGASQSEMFATFTALSGVTGSTRMAATQMAAAATALLTRTDAMDKAFKALGVTSAKALVAKKGGLVPAMQALVGTTDGSAESIQALVGNVRAARAVMNLTAAGADRFTKALDANSQAAGATKRSADAVAKGAGAMAREFDKSKAKAAELERAIGDRVKKPFVDSKVAVLNLANALTRDFVDAMDIVDDRAQKFEGGSTGTNFSERLRQAAGLARAGGVLVGAGAEAVSNVAAAGGALVAGGGSGAGDIRRQFGREIYDLGSRTRFQLGVAAQQIYDPEAARARADLARIGAAARAETQEAGGTRIQRAAKGLVRGDVNVALQGVSVTVQGGDSQQALDGFKRLGESLGDRITEYFGSQTEAP